jgi:hypothetical protein
VAHPDDWRSAPPPDGPYEATKLSTAVTEILNEARTVVPGMQAFIGFQLVAVFNASFWERLTDIERGIHVVAILLNIVAMVLLITPPLYHRQRESGYDSAGLVKLASKLLTLSTYPLIAAVALDLYLIGRLVGGSLAAGLATATVVLLPAVLLWHVMPRNDALREWLRR